ncbi:MAG: phosphopantothenate--cysteine ligase [Oscillospiraceae bacterium]|nr:phosphopantothenate--cysteine ligase [Oscillospiraceae bacterium]
MQSNGLSVLVTAGGTIEDIDTVRSITNHSTGRLGSLVADEFAAGGARITYLCAESAVRPQLPPERTVTIRSAGQLAQTLECLLREQRFDCVVHSMAVSDFTPTGVLTIEGLASALQQRISGGRLSPEAVSEALASAALAPQKKITSRSGQLLLALEQTPKAIGMIKALQPDTLLVGFKLLSGVGEDELVTAGQGLIRQNGCGFVLCNDLSGIGPEEHEALLLGNSGVVGRAQTKAEIARMIFEQVCEEIGVQT